MAEYLSGGRLINVDKSLKVRFKIVLIFNDLDFCYLVSRSKPDQENFLEKTRLKWRIFVALEDNLVWTGVLHQNSIKNFTKPKLAHSQLSGARGLQF